MCDVKIFSIEPCLFLMFDSEFLLSAKSISRVFTECKPEVGPGKSQIYDVKNFSLDSYYLMSTFKLVLNWKRPCGNAGPFDFWLSLIQPKFSARNICFLDCWIKCDVNFIVTTRTTHLYLNSGTVIRFLCSNFWFCKFPLIKNGCHTFAGLIWFRFFLTTNLSRNNLLVEFAGKRSTFRCSRRRQNHWVKVSFRLFRLFLKQKLFIPKHGW